MAAGKTVKSKALGECFATGTLLASDFYFRPM